MTLIDYHNNFWREYRKKAFSPNETLLYFFLLDVWNNNGRTEEFECSTKEIELILEMNKVTLSRCRETLRKRGVIQYVKGDRKIKNPYYIFCNVTNNVTNNVTKDVTNNVTNNKENPPLNPHKENNLESLREKERNTKVFPKKEKFIPPTLQEVHAYIAEQGYHVDPDIFISFYESKGWMVGKNRMKDWKAAVRTWARKDTPAPQSVKPYEIGTILTDNNPNKYSETW